MGWDFVAQAAEGAAAVLANLAAQFAQFAEQQVNLLLLAEDGAIERIDLILQVTGFEFEFGQAVFHGVVATRRLKMRPKGKPCVGVRQAPPLARADTLRLLQVQTMFALVKIPGNDSIQHKTVDLRVEQSIMRPSSGG